MKKQQKSPSSTVLEGVLLVLKADSGTFAGVVVLIVILETFGDLSAKL